MKKALIVTTVSGFVPQFEMNNVKILQELGYEVHYASNYKTPTYGTDNQRLDNTGIIQHQIDFVRSPFAIRNNIIVYKQLKRLMTDINFNLIHCHTPMGGAMARLVAQKTHTRPVFYTAHGFHFYKGAPVLNWLIYYPVEKLLSRFTDVLITINKEDCERAKNFHARGTMYIPGVGIDTNQFHQIPINRSTKRKEMGISDQQTVILSVGELSKRKNYETALNAFASVNDSNAIYLICGKGLLENKLKDMARILGISDRVRFLGYRTDILEIMKCADIFLFPSYQEGLPMALMEAMVAGLPVVCSRIRGNIDLIIHKEGGYLSPPNNTGEFANYLTELVLHPTIREKMGSFNASIITNYDIKHIGVTMRQLYEKSEEFYR